MHFTSVSPTMQPSDILTLAKLIKLTQSTNLHLQHTLPPFDRKLIVNNKFVMILCICITKYGRLLIMKFVGIQK